MGRNDFLMSPKFRPMLAAKITTLSELKRYPYLCTPKIDGIRCVTMETQQHDLLENYRVEGVSRVLKRIPNRHIQMVLGQADMVGLDGELVTFTNGKMDSYNTVQSKVMSEAGEPEFEFMVFDIVEPLGYWERMSFLKDQMTFPVFTAFKKLLPVLIPDERHLMAYEQACLEKGFEGVMLRVPDGPYKFGRSTFKESYLLKLKRFEDSEATVVGFEELMHNDNEAGVNALGLTERSDHKANMRGGNTLGALIVQKNEVQFKIGTGFDNVTRQDIWDNREKYMGQLVKFKHQPHGQKDAPRCPVFLGFRSIIDLS